MNSPINDTAPAIRPASPKSSFAMRHTLMVQGTTSDAGKSILVTALCRILARHKITVAPFKPQNMALNSAVSSEGGEIGRAQAVQAEACYLPASTLMNPVLLKPNSDLGAQVIVNGQAIGNMQAKDYHHYKPELLKTVVASHGQLQQHYQAVIVEGAGSPAEINLRAHDIANMGFAEAIDCPVIIVADIDRGGVFAHLYGTYALLSESEKQRVVGFVINRFRGDVSLLDSGLDWLEKKTGVPTLAVIPYIPKLHIEAEDSLVRYQNNDEGRAKEIVKVVVPMYPRASNHTDFDALRMHPQIDCVFMKEPSEFSGADLIVLPGSKNVRGDLAWLKTQGWQAVIEQHYKQGGKVIGICGGYQMLGQWINDPDAVESEAGSSEGLGILAIETKLTQQKTLRNVSGIFKGFSATKTEAIAVKGYEIHAGISQHIDGEPLFTLNYTDDASKASFSDGAQSVDQQVIGTYLHGLFDQPELVDACLGWLGVKEVQHFDYAAFKDAEINRLADEVEKVLPIETLARLVDIDWPYTKAIEDSDESQ